MARIRDYKAEYRRRIERGLKKGLSRSQARGHAKSGEKPASRARKLLKRDPKLEDAFKELRRGASLSKAAKSVHVSRERLRRFVGDQDLAQWKKRKWVVTDKRPRRVSILSEGKQVDVVVRDLKEAMRAGAYWDAQGRFIRTNTIALLAPFEGQGITDIKGHFWTFETDPNELHRIASIDAPVFHEIYQIVSN